MSIRIEVAHEAQPGETVCLSGEDPSLGAWDTSKAIRLANSSNTWSADIPIPSGGQFKFLLQSTSGEPTWEALDRPRCWPSSGLSEGACFRTRFGEMKMSIEASTEEIEKRARSFRDLEQRRGSALQEDLDRKGSNAYYHAHNRAYEVPEDAKVISGPGLITGGAPLLMEVGAETMSEDDRTMWLKDYSWSDSGAKVKVYVPIAEGVLPEQGADAMVEATYTSSSVDVSIKARPKQRLKIEKLNADVVAESCTTRVEPKKNRIVLQLVKKRETTTWYNLTKSK